MTRITDLFVEAGELAHDTGELPAALEELAFRRALARRAVSASASVAPPVGGWRGAPGGPRRRPATRTAEAPEARTA